MLMIRARLSSASVTNTVRPSSLLGFRTHERAGEALLRFVEFGLLLPLLVLAVGLGLMWAIRGFSRGS